MIKTNTLIQIPYHYATNFKEIKKVSIDNRYNFVLDFGPSWYFVLDCRNSSIKYTITHYNVLRLLNE